ncbi:MAG: penicillin-binding transpeptidase domain-containing protein [Armatimonadota bacterium]
MITRIRLLVVLIIVLAGLMWTIFSYNSSRSVREPWEANALIDKQNASPALVHRVTDRHHVSLIVAKREMAGRHKTTVLEHPFGSALSAVGIGRSRSIGGVLAHLRDPGFDSPWAPTQLSAASRWLLGDTALCPKTLPEEVTTTYDAVISQRVYETLQKFGKVASVVVMGVPDGDVLASVDFPGPDVDESKRPPDKRHSLSVFLPVRPASSMKTITTAYMLTYGRGDPHAVVNCDGVNCWRRHGKVKGLRRALVDSCNNWFGAQVQSFDRKEFECFLAMAGFLPRPVLGIPDASAIMPLRGDSEVNWAEVVGLQVWTTPLALAAAYGTCTDPEGRRVTPRVLLQADGQSFVLAERLKVTTPEVTAEIRAHLRAVATTGTARSLGKMLGGHVGAKTGTGPDGDALLAVVYPIEQPRYVMILHVQGGGSGSRLTGLAARIVRTLADG